MSGSNAVSAATFSSLPICCAHLTRGMSLAENCWDVPAAVALGANPCTRFADIRTVRAMQLADARTRLSGMSGAALTINPKRQGNWSEGHRLRHAH